MIALLRGQVALKDADYVVIDVSGVGYRVSMPARALEALSIGEQATLHISTSVREDAITLFGFPTPIERDAFEQIRGVSGIGPQLGLALLGQLPLGELVQAIASENTAALTRVRGVGKKTASRMVLELKNKLPQRFGVVASAPARRAPDPLILALAQLGYRKSEIDRVLASDDIPPPDEVSLEQRLSWALRVQARF